MVLGTTPTGGIGWGLPSPSPERFSVGLALPSPEHFSVRPVSCDGILCVLHELHTCLGQSRRSGYDLLMYAAHDSHTPLLGQALLEGPRTVRPQQSTRGVRDLMMVIEDLQGSSGRKATLLSPLVRRD